MQCNAMYICMFAQLFANLVWYEKFKTVQDTNSQTYGFVNIYA